MAELKVVAKLLLISFAFLVICLPAIVAQEEYHTDRNEAKIFSVSSESQKKNLVSKVVKRGASCRQDHPNLSIGDTFLTTSNFMKFKKDNQLFVLGISDSECVHCCHSELLLHSLWEDFQDQIYTFQTKKKKTKTIKVARIDTSKKHEFLKNGEEKNLQATDLPRIYVYFDGVYHQYYG